ncbi:MAG: NAD(P)H-dependent oxidoreductase, partial [Anaerovoracaceae bacterium]
MADLTIINPLCADRKKTERLDKLMQLGLEGYTYNVIESEEEFLAADLRNTKLIFSISLGTSGINLEFYNMLKIIRLHPGMFEGSVGGVIIDGQSELYTKSVSRDIVFTANQAGCTFPGRPLVEGTGTLDNYKIIAKNLNTDNLGAYMESGKDLIDRVVHFQKPEVKRPNILMLHAGNNKTSNTLSLWGLVKEGLENCDITEISLRNGEVLDCRGCSYETCLHFGEEQRCFYGGVITNEVYPAILSCDALVMVCPNYNDAISANLTAFINRLTSIFRVHRFYKKRLYA